MVKYGTSPFDLGCSDAMSSSVYFKMKYGLRTLTQLVELVYTEELYGYLRVKRYVA